MRSSAPARLAVCLAASILVHLTVLWPAMGRALSAAPAATNDPPPPVPAMQPPPVQPGVEVSDAVTLTWVGYEEYREHLARLSEVEQAAFTTAAGGSAADVDAAGDGGTPEAGTSVEAAESARPVAGGSSRPPSERPVEDRASAAADLDAAAPPEAGSDVTAEVEPGPRPEPTSTPPSTPGSARRGPTNAGEGDGSGPRPLTELAREGPLRRDRPSLAAAVAAAPSELDEEAAERSIEPEADAPSASASHSAPPAVTAAGGPAEPADADADADANAADLAAATDAVEQLERALEELRAITAVLAAMSPAGGQGGEAQRSVIGRTADGQDGDAVPRDGEIAEQESPATSRIDVARDDLRPDRPIAREGLEIRPREPVFLSIERVTASPRNPVALITFGRDGVPIAADLVRTTGDARIDQAITSSLFRWRAAGPRLAELPPDGTIALEFRILVNPRR